jgi:hypothetical protein
MSCWKNRFYGVFVVLGVAAAGGWFMAVSRDMFGDLGPRMPPYVIAAILVTVPLVVSTVRNSDPKESTRRGGYFANRREIASLMQLCDSHGAGRQAPAIGRPSRRWGARREPASAGGALGEGVPR